MRLITWNCCRGPYARKLALLDAFSPDIVVVQECSKPPTESDQCLWFGDNPRQGLAVQAYGDYRVRALPERPDVPNYIVPVEVNGPHRFLLLAVWAKRNPEGNYVEGVIRAVHIYRRLFRKYPDVVVMGDINSNAIWDAEHKPHRSHSALVQLLAQFGLVSSYHVFHQEPHGKESKPTFYFTWKEPRPFHLDYCFVPERWATTLNSVEVGSFDDWKTHSDHRPLIVDLK
jgi:exonuclease III